MAIFSTLRSRRINHHKTQAIEQIIGFRLDQEWFALPILAIYKVVPLGKIYGDPQDTGISLTTYEGQELLVIDVAKQIFNQTASNLNQQGTTNSLESNISDLDKQRYLLILENQDHNFLGLPIDSQPTMYRVETNAFKPLPEAYLEKGNIQCLTSQIVELPGMPPLFVLDLEKLISSTNKQ